MRGICKQQFPPCRIIIVNHTAIDFAWHRLVADKWGTWEVDATDVAAGEQTQFTVQAHSISPSECECVLIYKANQAGQVCLELRLRTHHSGDVHCQVRCTPHGSVHGTCQWDESLQGLTGIRFELWPRETPLSGEQR